MKYDFAKCSFKHSLLRIYAFCILMILLILAVFLFFRTRNHISGSNNQVSTSPKNTSAQNEFIQQVAVSKLQFAGSGIISFAIATMPQGNPCFVYYDNASGKLKYSKLLDGEWSVEIVDPKGSPGQILPTLIFPALVFDHDGNAGIAYCKAEIGFSRSQFSRSLYYSYNMEEEWDVQKIYGNGGICAKPDIVITKNGNVYISCIYKNSSEKYGDDDFSIIIATKQSNEDKFKITEIILSSRGDASIASIGNNCAIAYTEGGQLYYGVFNGRQLSKDAVAGVDQNSAIIDFKINQYAQPYIIYSYGREMRIAKKQNGFWMCETIYIYPVDHQEMYASLAFTLDGDPAICYVTEQPGSLVIALKQSELWKSNVVSDDWGEYIGVSFTINANRSFDVIYGFQGMEQGTFYVKGNIVE